MTRSSRYYRASKRIHQCVECNETIEIGDEYVSHDGQPVCMRCAYSEWDEFAEIERGGADYRLRDPWGF